MVRILAMIASMGFLIWLLFTDLDPVQRWLLSGMIWAMVVATWDRK